MDDFEDDYGAATARYYDAAYATLPDLGADVDFYTALARETGGPVLELGCGTGRVLLELARAGFACTGVDLSAGMLERLAAKAVGLDPAPRLVRAAMQEFDLGGQRFGLVYSAFRAFQHLYGVDDQLACLARVRRHLAPGGVFAFDVFHPRLDVVWQEEGPEELDLAFEIEGDRVERHVRQTRSRTEQLLRLVMRWERRRNGELVSREQTRFRMRWFTRFELEHLMHRAGFAHVEIFGDFDRSPVGRESPALVVVAREG